MRRFGLVVGTAVGTAALALLAAGCGGSAGAGAQGGVSTQPAARPAVTLPAVTELPGRIGPAMPPRLPAGSEPVAGTRVDASALPAGYPRLVWTQGDGSTLGFLAEQGTCQTVSASVTAQTATEVTVRLLNIQPASTKPCPHDLIDKPMTVRLAQPLGQRTVIMQAAIERG